MNIQVSMPAFSTVGIFPSQIRWNSTGTNFESYPWDPLNINITVTSSLPQIVQMQPSQISSTGGDAVRVLIAGFPPDVSSTNLSIMLGAAQCKQLSVSASDIHGAIITFVPPSHVSGMVLITVTYESGIDTAETFVASTPLAVMSDEFSFNCIQGCIYGCSRKTSYNATLELGSNTGQQIPSDTLITGLNCSISVGGYFRRCIVWNFTIVTSYLCQSQAQQNCLKFTVKFGLDEFTKASLPSPFTQGFFALQSSNVRFQGLIAMIQFQRPPTISTAIFANNWASITLTFDQSVFIGSWPGCSIVLNNETIGLNPSCTWIDDKDLVVVLGEESQILPGGTLLLSSNISDVNGLTLSLAPQGIEVSQPSLPQLPEITVSGPSSISRCDVATISVTATSSRNSYVWGCSNDNFLDLVFSNNTDSVLLVNGSLLQSGKSYYITVQVKTLYGASSSVFTQVVGLSGSPLPLVAINLPAPPVFRSVDMYIQGSAVFSKCAATSTSLTFLWSLLIVELNSSSLVVLQSSNPVLFVPAGTLKANQEYQVVLTATTEGQLPGIATTSFTVQSEGVKAVISGGSRYVYVGAIIGLDGSQSQDPDDCPPSVLVCDSTKTLAFEWECLLGSGQPCRFANGSVAIFPRFPRINVDLNSLGLVGVSEIQIVLTVSKQGALDAQSIFVALSSSPVIDVQIALSYSTASRVAFQSTVYNSDVIFNWTIACGTTTIETKDVSTFLAGFSNSNFVFRLDTPFAASVFQSGFTYKVSLNVVSSSGIGKSWLYLTLPLPPSSGTCYVYPLLGYALSTEFTITCNNWVGNTLPLLYSFSVRSSSIVSPLDSSITWSPLSSSAIFSTHLPNGNYSIAIQIMDAQGYTTVVSPATVVVLGSSPLDTNLMSSLFLQYNLQSQTSQVLMLVDSLATNINSAPGATCSSNSCRRLLGSSMAYRMAVRRLLLHSLSGSVSASVSARTAPTLLKSVKRVAAVPSEISSDALGAAQNQLSNFQQLDLQTLQSGALVNVMKLSDTLIESAVPTMGVNPLDLFNVNIITAVLSLAKKYWSGMLSGETPLSVHVTDLSLDVIQSFSMDSVADVIFLPDTLNDSRRVLSDGTVGSGVVRLSPALSADSSSDSPSDGSQQSDVVGIGIWDPEKPVASGQTWLCPVSNQNCIRFGFTFSGRSNDFNITCLRWSGSVWKDANCRISTENSQVHETFSINCSCSADGVFKAEIVSKQNAVVVLPFSIAIGFTDRASSSWAATTMALGGCFVCIVCWVLVHLGHGQVCTITESPSPLKFWKFEDCEPPHRKSTMLSDKDSVETPWTGQAQQTRKIEVSGSALTVSAEICFPLRPTHLESVRPPITFLGED